MLLGFMGVVCVAISVLCGLGITSLANIDFNATTLQVKQTARYVA